MPRKRVRLNKKTHRPILSDVLPFEVPPTFSNRHFYKFLTDNEVEISGQDVIWKAGGADLDRAMALILGLKPGILIQSSISAQWGRSKHTRTVPVKHCQFDTIPFCFRVSHRGDEARTLSVVHPRSQLFVSAFYKRHAPSIIYHCSRSEFSIRHPVSVANVSFFRDRTHQFRLDVTDKGVEEDEREYEQTSSYFVYRKYSNIHRFFESYQYHRSEKKYDAMVQIDISKCFDSIYTHSVVWAILGKSQTKFNLTASTRTFGGHFDRLMQLLNQRETNGIVIGPEFSRIFAEIILQAVDVAVEKRLSAAGLRHKTDYEVFRYVDDYFVFYNDLSTSIRFNEVLRQELLTYKLHVNPSKMKTYEKPIITEITIAKDRISTLLNAEISRCFLKCEPQNGEAASGASAASCVHPNRLIIRFKTILTEANVKYSDVLNYTLSVVENKTLRIMGDFSGAHREHLDQVVMARSLKDLLEFVFFIYAASPRVNHTIRLVRTITTIVDFLNDQRFGFELKHMVFKYIHDNLAHQLDKNRSNAFREVETLYLLTGLAHLGREYWLPETTLASYFGVKRDDAGEYTRTEHLNYFSITVALSYMRGKLIYSKLRAFLEAHVLGKLTYMKAHCPNDAENLMLFLDLIVCPHVSNQTKLALASIYGFQPNEVASLQSVSDRWFTSWDTFDLAKELDAKRSREVY